MKRVLAAYVIAGVVKLSGCGAWDDPPAPPQDAAVAAPKPPPPPMVPDPEIGPRTPECGERIEVVWVGRHRFSTPLPCRPYDPKRDAADPPPIVVP